MTCPPVDTLSDLLDNALPLPNRWRVRWHTKHCMRCSGLLAAETRLRESVRAVGANAAAPETLRTRLRAAVPLRPAVRRRAPALAAMALCGSLLLTCAALLLRPVVAPLPAFAQVVTAMQQIHTAHWQEEAWVYDIPTKKTLHYETRYSARLSPPALAATYSWGRREVVTPEILTGKQGEDFGATVALGFSFRDRKSSVTPRSWLREYVLDKLVAPRQRGGGSAAWRSAKERVGNRDLLRFESDLSREAREATVRPPKLTRPGYRYMIWADPATLRIVRSETEYYDGQKHTRGIVAHYEYDLVLPPDTFTSQKPKSRRPPRASAR